MLQAIVMDMDGTLLDKNNEILKETKEALITCEKQGIKLVLASGRSYTRLLRYADQLELVKYGGYLLEVDGIAIYDMRKNERHVLRRMEPEEFRSIFNDFVDLGAETHAVFDDGIFCRIPDEVLEMKKALRKQLNLDDDFPWTAGPWSWFANLNDGYPKLTYIKDFDEIHGLMNKLQIMQDEDKLADIYQKIQAKYNDRFEIFRTTPRQLEVLPYGFSKGKTLTRMMNELNWDKDNVFVFGDGENDVSMFKSVVHSFAMGQAKDYVKEKAAHITSSNNEQGILAALEQFHILY